MNNPETGSPVQDNLPIWKRPNAEMYASSPGQESYVIWKYTPGEDGVRKFPKFDEMDPLPHHYYKTEEEYVAARNTHSYGGDPEAMIIVNVFDSSRLLPVPDNVVVVDFGKAAVSGQVMQDTPQAEQVA